MKILGNSLRFSADSMVSRDALSSSNMRYCFFSPHFIDGTLITKVEFSKKCLFLANLCALRFMGI